LIPLVTRTAASLAHWLSPAYDGALRIEPHLDGVDALAPEREALWARVGAASFLTDDEKREAVGYGAKPVPAKPAAGKGGWGGVDSLPGDVVASPGGGDGLGGGGGGSWQNQPRVPAGNGEESGRWTDGGGGVSGISHPDDRLITGAGGTTDMNFAARMLRLDRNEFGDMIHALKDDLKLRPSDNVKVFPNGDVFFQDKPIGNLWDYKK
jgi:hypothetical protein